MHKMVTILNFLHFIYHLVEHYRFLYKVFPLYDDELLPFCTDAT